ncbi:hypothetical protein F7Q99_36295 [Streptomyces kaniharaensis]|uniref:Uncharacterized protein n=1 Tax=Streptomyces kaniharaensis TaxID=212423 RepID=A0A6N7L587_9ACTN|nr:hypothetical protein [Streptomyces kaniharaensis]MQS17504.1 hypothetical protein [Streptomyces kaniharaensis]
MGADTDFIGAVSVQPPIPLADFEDNWIKEDTRFELLSHAPWGTPVVLGLLATDDCHGKSGYALDPLMEFLRVCLQRQPEARFHSALRYADFGCSGRVVVTATGGIEWEADPEEGPSSPAGKP